MPRPEYTLSSPVSRNTAQKRRWRAGMLDGTWQPFVDHTVAMEHVRALKAAGWSRDALHEATGVSVIAIERLVRGERTKIRPETEERLLRARLDPRSLSRHLLIPGIGPQRRIAAMTFMAWGYKDMSAESGIYWTVFERAMHRPRVNAGLAADVADLYDRIGMTMGPSKRTRTLAIQRGRLGPLAWDDTTIDDPTASPNVGDRVPCPR